jgi:hypothetical protein
LGNRIDKGGLAPQPVLDSIGNVGRFQEPPAMGGFHPAFSKNRAILRRLNLGAGYGVLGRSYFFLSLPFSGFVFPVILMDGYRKFTKGHKYL